MEVELTSLKEKRQTERSELNDDNFLLTGN